MAENDLQLLRELVALDTNSVTKSNYEEMAKLLKEKLKGIGAKVDVVYAKAPDGKPRPNVIGRIDNGAAETIGLNSHFDVVTVNLRDWKTDPFRLTIRGERAFGRGSVDDKSGIVASLIAAQNAKSKTNIELIYTCDEEVGSRYGLEWVVKNRRKAIRSDYAVILDTRKKIAVGGSGVTMGRIVVRGKEVHAGYPFQGKNAVAIALPFLQKLQAFEGTAAKYVSRYRGDLDKKVYGRFNITVVHAGDKENIIPGVLEAKFDMRSPPEVSVKELQRKFIALFDKTRREYGIDARLEFTALHDSYLASPNSKIVRKLISATGEKNLYGTFGGNDGTFLFEAGIPTVAYGVGNPSRHRANEYVNVSSMRTLERELVTLLETF